MRGLSRAGPVDKAAEKPFLRQWFPWIWSHGFRRAACLGKSTGWYPLTSAMNCSRHTIRQLAVHLTALSVYSKRSCSDICMGSNRSGGWQRKFGSISPIADSVDSSWVTPSRITLPSAKPGGENGGRAASFRTLSVKYRRYLLRPYTLGWFFWQAGAGVRLPPFLPAAFRRRPAPLLPAMRF